MVKLGRELVHTGPDISNLFLFLLVEQGNDTLRTKLRQIPKLRYLDASGSGLDPEAASYNHMLVFLSLARCRLIRLRFNLRLPNLLILDLSHNQLDTLSHDNFRELHNLRFGKRLNSRTCKKTFKR
jgi:hypothetical protein